MQFIKIFKQKKKKLEIIISINEMRELLTINMQN